MTLPETRSGPRRTITGLFIVGALTLGVGLILYYPDGANDTGALIAFGGLALIAAAIALLLIYALVRFIKASARG